MPKSRFKRVNEGSEAHNGSRDTCQDRGWTVGTGWWRVGRSGKASEFSKASNEHTRTLGHLISIQNPLKQ